MRNGFEVYAIAQNHNGDATHVAGPLMMEPITETSSLLAHPRDPTFFIDRRAAQSLMNELYAAGLRPDDAAHVNDALLASKEHIADLRRVAFGLMDCIVKSVAGDDEASCAEGGD